MLIGGKLLGGRAVVGCNKLVEYIMVANIPCKLTTSAGVPLHLHPVNATTDSGSQLT